MAGTAPWEGSSLALANIHSGRYGEPLSFETFQNIVREAIEDATRFIDDELADPRSEAAKYYAGKPMGNEVRGRSQIVMSEVRDVVHTIIPGLMRLFTGQEHAVEFQPVEENDTDFAELATDYIDHIFSKENDGFQNIYNCCIDGLVKKVGILKWWHERDYSVVEERYEGLSMEQAAQLRMEPGVIVLEEELVQPEHQSAGGGY